jgi:hypothetical protein
MRPNHIRIDAGKCRRLCPEETDPCGSMFGTVFPTSRSTDAKYKKNSMNVLKIQEEDLQEGSGDKNPAKMKLAEEHYRWPLDDHI